MRSRTGSLPPSSRCWPTSPKIIRSQADRHRASPSAHFCVPSLTGILEFFRNLLYYPEIFDTVLEPIRCPHLKTTPGSPRPLGAAMKKTAKTEDAREDHRARLIDKRTSVLSGLGARF